MMLSKATSLLVVGFLCACSIVFAADQPAAGKSRIVITSEPLLGKSADVELNGRRIASVNADQPYSSLYEPGKMVVAVKGGKVEFDAQANKEYVLEVAIRPLTGASGFFFGPLGMAAVAEYMVTLKETRDIQ